MKIKINKISNYLINIGILLSIYSLYTVYKSRVGLPTGACPIDENQGLLYFSVFISLLGVITSYIPSK